MARIPKKPYTFFCVGPASQAKLECFAVKRGELSVRMDPKHFALRGVISSPFSVVTLGALVLTEPNYGLSARAKKRTYADEPRYIRITDFGEDGIEPDHEFVTADPVESGYDLNENDVLFARTGATVGKTYLHEDTTEPAIFAGYCIRFQFDMSRVSPKLVYWWTKTATYSRWVQAIQRPSGQPNVNREEFKSCPIPVPPILEQDSLVGAMEGARAKYKEKVAEAEALLASLDEVLQDALGIVPPREDNRRVFAVRFGQVSGNRRIDSEYYHPERTTALRSLDMTPADLEVAPLVEKVSFPRQLLPAPTETYLSLAHVQSHTGELTEASGTASGTCLSYQLNDVLFARLRPYLNKVHRAETNGSCSTEFRVLRVTDPNVLLPDYLAAILRSRVILAQTIHMMTGNTHPRLTDQDIENLRIPIPKVEVQRTISDEINRRREESRRLRVEAEIGWQAAKEWFEEQLLGTVAT